MDGKRIHFRPPEPSRFGTELKRRVDAYFRDHNLSPHATTAMQLKVLALFLSSIGLYFLILLSGFPPWALLLTAILFGMTSVLFVLNVAGVMPSKFF